MENYARVNKRGKSSAPAPDCIPPSIPKRKSSGVHSSTPPSSANASLDDDDDVDQQSDGLLSVQLSDLPLDCPICDHPLSIPVFQCMYGHVLCSDCCAQVNNKCPSCKRRTGRIRCRAIETVLEAIKLPCTHNSYGCPEELSYYSKTSHESTCPYTPYGCPFGGCTFVGSHPGLFLHMRSSHLNSVVSLQLGQACRFSMGVAEELVVFREEVDGKLFFLNKPDRMSISCIASGDHSFSYALVVRGKDTSFRFQSVTSRFGNGAKGVGIVQLPGYLGDPDGCLQLQLCIWSKGSPPVDIAGTLF